MPMGLSRVDVEVWQVFRCGWDGIRRSALTTMEMLRDGLGRWRLEAVAERHPGCGLKLEKPPPRLLGDAAVEGLK